MSGWAKPAKAAEHADVSVRVIRQWMGEGLPYSKMSRSTTLISIEDLDAYIKKRQHDKHKVDDFINDIIAEL